MFKPLFNNYINSNNSQVTSMGFAVLLDPQPCPCSFGSGFQSALSNLPTPTSASPLWSTSQFSHLSSSPMAPSLARSCKRGPLHLAWKYTFFLCTVNQGYPKTGSTKLCPLPSPRHIKLFSLHSKGGVFREELSLLCKKCKPLPGKGGIQESTLHILAALHAQQLSISLGDSACSSMRLSKLTRRELLHGSVTLNFKRVRQWAQEEQGPVWGQKTCSYKGISHR